MAKVMGPDAASLKKFSIVGILDTSNYAFLIVSYAIAISIYGLKLHERKITIIRIVGRALTQTLLTIILFITLYVFVEKSVPRTFLSFFFIADAIGISLTHIAINLSIRALRRLGRNTISTVIVGADENAIRLYKEMSYGQGINGYKVNGYFTGLYADNVPEGVPILGSPSEAEAYIRKFQLDEVYCSLSPDIDGKLVNGIIKACDDKFVSFYYVPNMDGYLRRRMVSGELGQVTVIKLREEPLNNPISKSVKRFFDILISGLFLLLVYPWVWAIVAIGIKLTSPGPILFRQDRTGYSGKSFSCLKFRSMKVNKDADKVQATENDPRKTKFGDFLRKTSIDELPQFINVFKGDMSLVGPRPHMIYHTDVYSDLISDYMVRHLVKPGITGWAQINGCRGETKTLQEMKDRVDHDIWYIEHWSIALDFEIMFRTAVQILGGDKQAF
ncbi:MAG: undecaprenyl-phosphate glucose phosphotransferase [Bacteroidales bacterium]|nr:undecaprenyl-phosphate glucose phosphotransferase [Bacteroidales bacterium]